MRADSQAFEQLAELPEVVTLAAGYSHTLESGTYLLAEFGYRSNVLETIQEFGLAIPCGTEWRLDADLRRRVLLSAPREMPEAWRQAHEYLFSEAIPSSKGDNHVLPAYQTSGVGLAYHGTELNAELGLEGYRSLALIDSVALSLESMHLAEEQIRRGLVNNTDSSIVFLRGMTYYRMGLTAEAVALLRRIATEGLQTRETAIAQHLVGNWDCLRSRRANATDARHLLSASHKLAAKLGDEVHLAHVKHTMALCILKTDPGHKDSAVRLLRQSLRLTEEHGDLWGEAKVLHSLGQALGGTPEGRRALERSLQIGQELGYSRHVASVRESIYKQGNRGAKVSGTGHSTLGSRGATFVGRASPPRVEATAGRGETAGLSSRGAVKWFDAAKGFGFISIENEDRDVFVHVSELEGKTTRMLAQGDLVTFEKVDGKNGPTAKGVRKIVAKSASTQPVALTKRERELLYLIAKGAGNREIAKRLDVHESAVKHQVARILGKLGAHSRTQAIGKAQEFGFI